MSTNNDRHRQRVVFIPGFMGSMLVDQDIKGMDKTQKQALCDANLGSSDWRRRIVSPVELDLCKNPENIWGTIDMLPWVFNQDGWFGRLTKGLNGSGDILTPTVSRRGLISLSLVEIQFPGIDVIDVSKQPYESFLKFLEALDIDILIFPYDWRLSNVYNACLLSQAIQNRWGQASSQNKCWRYLKRQQVRANSSQEIDNALLSIPQSERVTIIAHSMGGLLARCYIESQDFMGFPFVKNLVTVGTPHLGAPKAYTNLLGKEPAFDFPFADIFMPLIMQKNLMQLFASAIELLPVYPFVKRGSSVQDHEDTYKPFSLPGIVSNVNRILRQFRQHLISPQNLDRWLACKEITYHFLAERDIETTVKYDALAGRPIAAKAGDGTVPFFSAQMNVDNRGTVNIWKKALHGGQKDHVDLFENPEVENYCRTLLVTDRIQNRAIPERTSTSKLLELAKEIFKRHEAVKRNRIVYCLTRIEFHADDNEAIIPDLIDSIPGLSSSTLYLIEDGDRIKRSYVLIESELPTVSSGGALFLPYGCRNYIEIVTWNTGKEYEKRRGEPNNSHAEYQLVSWINKWSTPKATQKWMERIREMEITVKRVSPCCFCCVDLKELKQLIDRERRKGPFSDRKLDARISWTIPYEYKLEVPDANGSPPAPENSRGYTTTMRSLDILTDVGWVIDGQTPRFKGRTPCEGIDFS